MVSIINDTIQSATKADKALKAVLKFIREGWPNEVQSITTPEFVPATTGGTLSPVSTGVFCSTTELSFRANAENKSSVYFLVVVDPYTKWPEVNATKTTATKTTMKLLSQSFATFDVPETIVSDNGTQFTSHEFKTFCEQLGIRRIRTAPFHLQSNGLAERFVDTLKRTLRKIRSGGEGLEEALQIFLQVY